MTRVKRAYVAKRRRNGISAITTRSKRAHSRLSRTIQQQAIKSLTYSYKDRNKRKRDFRHLWIVRINAAARNIGISYSKFINRVKKLDIVLNRKMFSQIAVFNNNSINMILSKISDTAMSMSLYLSL
jgi:large subunit ribosomal protein L20